MNQLHHRTGPDARKTNATQDKFREVALAHGADPESLDGQQETKPAYSHRRKYTPARRDKKRSGKTPAQRLKKLWLRLRAIGIEDCPEGLAQKDWDISRLCGLDSDGWAVGHFLKQIAHKAGAVLTDRAATGMGKHKYRGVDHGARRARRIATLAIIILRNAKKDPDLQGPWKFNLKLIPQTLLCKLLTEPGAKPVHRSALSRPSQLPKQTPTDIDPIDADLEAALDLIDFGPDETDETGFDTTVGYLRALINVGLIETYQDIRPARPGETGPRVKKGKNCNFVVHVNEIRVIRDTPDDTDDEETLRWYWVISKAYDLILSTKPRQFAANSPPI